VHIEIGSVTFAPAMSCAKDGQAAERGKSNEHVSRKRFMRRTFLLLLAVMAFALSAFAQQQIVTFKGGIPAGFANKVTGLGGRVLAQHPVLAVVDGLTPAALDLLKAQTGGGISDVQADASFVLDDAVGTAEPADVAMSPANPAGAYFFGRQWNMRAIGAPAAWAAGKLGSPSTTVAVIDTGIDYSYPDLVGRVDLSRSISFAPSDDALVQANFPGKHLVTDINFHGTHVSATIVSNANVIAGVTSNITLIGVKVLATDLKTGNGSGTLGMVLSGVLYAADAGADVANMSLGGGFSKVAAGQYVSLINKVFTYAEKKGMLIVVAAGNAGADMDHNGNTLVTYCNQQHVVCVSATGPTAQVSVNGPWTNVDAPAYYTNYGRSAVDVAAPGGNYSYVYSACSRTNLITGLEVCRLDTTSVYVVGAIGTSMAAPHVTGLAALLIDQVGKGKPALLKQRIRQSADDLGQPGVDPFYGAGRINVKNALGIQ
jgi:lantibiotic leader peptide-processing serine protease